MKPNSATAVKTVLAAGLVLVLAVGSFAQEGTGLAESYLSRLARKSRNARMVGGGSSLALGGLFAVVGASALEDDDDGDAWISFDKAIGQAALITGAGLAVTGVLALSIPSPAERAWKKARGIEEPGLREERCAASLAGLSRKARRVRYIGAGLTAATGAVLFLVGREETSASAASTTALTCGGLAVLQLLMKSPAERAYAAYLAVSGLNPDGDGPRLTLGFGPRRSVAVTLRLEF